MLAKDVVDGDVDGHHQHQLVAVGAGGVEDRLGVVELVQVAAHLLDGAVLADLHDGGVGGVAVVAQQGVQDLLVDGGIVVLRLYESAHKMIFNLRLTSISCHILLLLSIRSPRVITSMRAASICVRRFTSAMAPSRQSGPSAGKGSVGSKSLN